MHSSLRKPEPRRDNPFPLCISTGQGALFWGSAKHLQVPWDPKKQWQYLRFC